MAAQEVGDRPGCIKSVQGVCPSIAFIESPWQAIKQWIPADDDDLVPVARGNDPDWSAHHSNESPWKPKEVPLDDDRILVLEAD
jgi:hypothetical protein